MDKYEFMCKIQEILDECKTQEEIDIDFGEYIAETVELLTHTKSEPYFNYINRIAESGNQDAIRVKLVDLEHNSQLDRLKVVTEKDIARVEKYKQATEILKGKLV